MVDETSKAVLRRLQDSRYATRYFVGNGIDIGAGNDSLGRFANFFPRMTGCRGWDMPDGDAQFLAGVPDESMDFVHSSHCLEHVENPQEALHHWLRVLKPGGHMVVMIPDEDLYEQGVFPSTFNITHRWTFAMCKTKTWSPRSINLMPFLGQFAGVAQILKLEQLDAAYFFGRPRIDQTLLMTGESALEFVLRKWLPDELARGGRLPPVTG